MPLLNIIGLRLAALALSLCASMATADVVVVVVVVSAKSSVAPLSKNQIVDIFLGKTSHFPDGSQAIPIDQAEGAAARDEFYTGLASKSAAQLKAYWSKIIFTGRGQPPREVANGTEVKKFIATNPAAIGYIERNLVDDSVKVVLAP
jgi:ABC-type phosphate transport system substrate-binding protein